MMTMTTTAATRLFADGYAPALEDRSLARLRDSYDMFIGGRFVAAADGARAATFDPSTAERLAVVAVASRADVDDAVAAANAALPTWAALPGAERAAVLFRVARLIAERSRELAVLESLDGGKPIREARDFDVPTAAQHFFHYAGWADKLAHVDADTSPVGVCAQVIPWNFPLLMAAWKVAPALAAGNTVVLKPAETTPLTALVLAEIAAEAGVPDGVLNVVCGAGDVGEALVAHPDVDKVAFTGSTAVGRRIAALCAGTHKRVTLELGGKSANIVFADAALDAAVEGVVSGIFFNQGHVCCAGSRLLVAESIADEFVQRLVARMGDVRVGAPLDKNTDMGAINSPAQLARISDAVDGARRDGIEVVSAPVSLPGEGCWFAPTLLVGVDPAHRVARDEIFGPVLSVMSFRTPAEAVERANDSTYGLAAGVWTEKGSRARWVASRLRAGVVWANTYNRFDPTSPFGGFRESGFGREGGRHGLEAYLGSTSRSAPLLDIPPSPQGPSDPPPLRPFAASAAATRPLPPSAAAVRPTVKMFVGGSFVRSESAATVPVHLGGATFEVPSASRKDARDAVAAAVAAQPGWAARTPYNRGQILYRVAEMMGAADADASRAWVRWAGWCDKVGHVLGSVNDVSCGPFDSVSSPVPTGVAAVVVSGSSLSQFADLVAAPLAAGCTVVAVVDADAVDLVRFGEVLAVSDVPAGVVNILTGARAEVAATLAAHSAVTALDVSSLDAAAAAELEAAASQNLCRVRGRAARSSDVARLRSFCEVRTVWHPRGR
jgi:aldehyde dehydrogenase (NAD+)